MEHWYLGFPPARRRFNYNLMFHTIPISTVLPHGKRMKTTLFWKTLIWISHYFSIKWVCSTYNLLWQTFPGNNGPDEVFDQLISSCLFPVLRGFAMG